MIPRLRVGLDPTKPRQKSTVFVNWIECQVYKPANLSSS